MSNLQITIFAGLSVCAGPLLFFRSFRDFRLRRLLQNTPTAHIRSMAMGLAEIKGTVSPRSEVHAPFSGKPCAFWEIDIATQRRGGWTTVHRNQSGHPFFVSDPTGVALVYPQGSDCKVRTFTEERFAGIAIPDCYAQYMTEQNLQWRYLWRLGALRFRERVLEEGQSVFILGSAEPRSQSFTISEGETLAATGTDGPPVRVAPLGREIVAVIRKGSDEGTFLISQESERELVANMGVRFLAKLIGGPLLTVVGLWILMRAIATHQLFR